MGGDGLLTQAVAEKKRGQTDEQEDNKRKTQNERNTSSTKNTKSSTVDSTKNLPLISNQSQPATAIIIFLSISCY
jgi:hypothetical protein